MKILSSMYPYALLRKTRVASVLAVLLLAIAGSVVIAPTAQAAVTCYGDYCSGKDPMSTRCSDGAYTVAYTQVYFKRALTNATPYAGLLELRWSPTCKTNWARGGRHWHTIMNSDH